MPLQMGSYKLALIQENKRVESNLCEAGRGRQQNKGHMSMRARTEPQMKDGDRDGKLAALNWTEARTSSLVSENSSAYALFPLTIMWSSSQSHLSIFFKYVPPSTRFILEAEVGEGEKFLILHREKLRHMLAQPSVPCPMSLQGLSECCHSSRGFL